MYLRIALSTYFLFICLFNGVSQTFSWASTVTCASARMFDVVSDAEGNSYHTGRYRCTIDFDPSAGVTTLTGGATDRMFIRKMGPGGEFLWAFGFGSDQNCAGNSVDLDAAGNVYVAGYMSGSVDFDPGPGEWIETSVTPTLPDIFILKLSASGEFNWVKRIGATGSDIAENICIDQDNNVIIAGNYTSPMDFDPNEGENIVQAPNCGISCSLAYVAKYDQNGNFLWTRVVDGSVVMESIDVDSQNNIVMVGSILGSVDLNTDPVDIPNEVTNTQFYSAFSDFMVLKIASNGDFIFAFPIGHEELEQDARDVRIDSQDNIIVAGKYSGTIDFDPDSSMVTTLTSGSNYDLFLAKYNATGTFIWAKSFDSVDAADDCEVRLSESDEIFIAGNQTDVWDFDPSPDAEYAPPMPTLGMSFFIAKYNSSGSFIWAHLFGGNGVNLVEALDIGSQDEIFAGGKIGSSADFDPSENSFVLPSPSSGIFILKLGDTVDLPGDFDGNGIISTTDLLELLSSFGCSSCPEYDLDNDGVVGTTDLIILLGAING